MRAFTEAIESRKRAEGTLLIYVETKENLEKQRRSAKE